MQKIEESGIAQNGEIVQLFLSQIKPYWRNPRINENSVDSVAQSIKDYGYNQYIVVDSHNTIIAGHTRYKALKKLEISEQIPVLRVELDPKKAKQYRIADNKSAERSKWDDAALIQELRETELGEMQIFFPEVNLDELIQISVGATKWNDVTDLDFSKSVTAEEMKIVELAAARSSAKRDVTCPHCGEDFQVI